MTYKQMRYAPYSYSKLGTYSTCPRKFKYSVIDKAPREPSSTVALRKGRAVHKLLESWPNPPSDSEHLPLVERFASSALGQKYLNDGQSVRELKFGITQDLQPTSYYDRDAMYRGAIDYVLRKGNRLYLIDWKTGKAKDQRWQDYEQLVSYAVYFFVRFPSIQEINISYVYVEHDDCENSMVLSRKYLDNYIQSITSKIIKCETDEEYPKTPNRLCEFCDFRIHCAADK